ncbi:MAG: hypothetical protein KKH52_01680 [Nanoarchaeota archaeon]|nr:hypothetical protein [Nanoarchaeota archaeon]MBU1622718.1 hypothetical protein [Nanoarchaeota archaeon]MBU1974082.1 hypothetical protein [Nanoarchaeota archaeon]
MKINYTTKNQRLNVEINSDSVKDAFKELAIFQEVFDEDSCQLCHNEELQFVVRTVDRNDFYELKCKKCFAKLAYGQHKSGGSLFPKRKNSEGNYDNNQGWHKWNGGNENV